MKLPKKKEKVFSYGLNWNSITEVIEIFIC